MAPNQRNAKKAKKPKKAPVLSARTQGMLPVWYQPDAVLGSAVRYVASLSPKFKWVGIYILKGKRLKLGPCLGAKSGRSPSDLVILVQDKSDKILGQIDIDSHAPNTFGPEEESAVRRVADELGALWPE